MRKKFRIRVAMEGMSCHSCGAPVRYEIQTGMLATNFCSACVREMAETMAAIERGEKEPEPEFGS